MKIRFNRMLMQRFRAVLHFVDPLLREKHELLLTLGRTRFNPTRFYADPWSIHAADRSAMDHLCKNFGLKVKGLNDVVWIKEKYTPCDLALSIDTRGIAKKTRTSKGIINIPYMGFQCYTPQGAVTVGNPLCESIRERQKTEKEKKGLVLIVHPGGGRDFLSPKRKKYSTKRVVANNIELMNNTIAHLTEATEIVIKTHPAPYSTCDCASMQSKVLPSLKSSCPISIREDDLIGLICQSEFVINYGSSTAIWLLGSPKKWVNIIDQCKFNLKAGNRRDRIERAENWWEWPQNIPLSDLRATFEDYKTGELSLHQKYRDLYNMNTVSKCMQIIQEFGA